MCIGNHWSLLNDQGVVCKLRSDAAIRLECPTWITNKLVNVSPRRDSTRKNPVDLASLGTKISNSKIAHWWMVALSIVCMASLGVWNFSPKGFHSERNWSLLRSVVSQQSSSHLSLRFHYPVQPVTSKRNRRTLWPFHSPFENLVPRIYLWPFSVGYLLEQSPRTFTIHTERNLSSDVSFAEINFLINFHALRTRHPSCLLLRTTLLTRQMALCKLLDEFSSLIWRPNL